MYHTSCIYIENHLRTIQIIADTENRKGFTDVLHFHFVFTLEVNCQAYKSLHAPKDYTCIVFTLYLHSQIAI